VIYNIPSNYNYMEYLTLCSLIDTIINASITESSLNCIEGQSGKAMVKLENL
jgi:hypothetical protein